MKKFKDISTADVTTEIYNRLEKFIYMTKRGTGRYAKLTMLLQWGVPLLSAILTAIASGRAGISEDKMNSVAFWLGLTITILTVANSTIRPAERFARSAAFFNEFSAFRNSLILEMKNIDLSATDSMEIQKTVNAFLISKDRELVELIHKFNSTFMPLEKG